MKLSMNHAFFDVAGPVQELVGTGGGCGKVTTLKECYVRKLVISLFHARYEKNVAVLTYKIRNRIELLLGKLNCISTLLHGKCFTLKNTF